MIKVKLAAMMEPNFFSASQLGGHKVLAGMFFLLFLCFFASPAKAHNVHIFAYTEGDLIKTESRFNGGRPARNCAVSVTSPGAKDVVATGKSDEHGFFHFQKPKAAGDLDIVITCGDGHRGSWLLEAEEFFAGEKEPASHVHPQAPAADLQAQGHDEMVLRKLIAEEVEKKVAPLRRSLAQLAEKKTTLQDILGGIGYLLGLAGLASYMKFKNKK